MLNYSIPQVRDQVRNKPSEEFTFEPPRGQTQRIPSQRSFYNEEDNRASSEKPDHQSAKGNASKAKSTANGPAAGAHHSASEETQLGMSKSARQLLDELPIDQRHAKLACGTQNQNSSSNLDTLLPHALKAGDLGCSSTSQSYRIQEYEQRHHQRSNPRGLQSTSQIFPYFRDFSNTNSHNNTNSASLRASLADKSP